VPIKFTGVGNAQTIAKNFGARDYVWIVVRIHLLSAWARACAKM
jgi:hypothetical protein